MRHTANTINSANKRQTANKKNREDIVVETVK